VPARHFRLAAEGYADALLRPVFKEEALEIEKRAIAMEGARRAANPIAILEDMVYRESFRVHPYGLPPGGDPAQLNRISVRTLQDYHRRFFVARNMTVVVVGDIATSEAFAIINATFGSASASSAPITRVQREPPLTEVRQTSATREVAQAAMAIAFPAPGIASPEDVCAMDVLLTLLGEGKTSRLHTLLKGEESLVSQYEADFLTQKDPGLFIITCVLDPENIEKVKALILEACARLGKEPVQQKELLKGKALLEGQYAASNETVDGQASSLGFYDAIDTYRFAIDYIDRIREVTAEDVQRVAQTYLHPQRYVLAVVRPRSASVKSADSGGVATH